jgi:UDP-2,3-diacylglucosamine hydrolase
LQLGALLVTQSDTPPVAELHAPGSWRTVDFISDLHLQAGEPATFQAWQHYMATTPADAVFILGDLFDVWIGDDVLGKRPADNAFAAGSSFEDDCAQVLRDAAGRLALFFMHGNRDFLLGQGQAATSLPDRCHFTLLDDPCALTFAGQRWLLSHGDALCLDDLPYMNFRRQVRSAAWQHNFLARPLAERQLMAQGMRQQSQQQHAQREKSGTPFIDLDRDATRAWLQVAGAPLLIHGHTHQPALHDLGDGLQRIVLSDWDANPAADHPRAEVLRLSVDFSGQPQRIELI